ncbi:MAG: hypothetical protein HQK67_11505 [Desulfamplus sp.]|nr:hypothetical protein [Desulfamplus sp.]
MITQPKIDILKIFANDKKLVLYRPEWRAITGSVLSTILLLQILYWWDKMGRKPFYKFKEPCGSQLYTEGDSWTEELGFSRTEFDTALKKIGVKISANNPPDPDSTHLVEYWTDINRVTYYTINADELEKVLSGIYVNQDSNFTQGGEPTLHVNQDSCFTKRSNPDLQQPSDILDVSSIKSGVNIESGGEEKSPTETTFIKKTTDNKQNFSAPPATLPEPKSPSSSSSSINNFKTNAETLQLIVALMILIPEHHKQEGGFRFLKDPLFFTSSLFLKKPSRIAGLLMVMTLALMVCNIAQRRLRRAMAAQDETIPNQINKPVRNPTLRWVFQIFEGINFVKMITRESVQCIIHGINDLHKKVIRFLGPTTCGIYQISIN